MKEDVFAEQWKQMRGELKSWWGKLADDDFDRIGGQKDKLMARYKRSTDTLAIRPSEKWSGASKNLATRRTEPSPA